MTHLTKKQFKNYLEGLEIIDTTAHDEVGGVCTVYPEKCECEFVNAIYKGVEYELTEKQKMEIASVIDRDILMNQSEAFEEMTSFEFYTNINV